jgi:hypothetical protein
MISFYLCCDGVPIRWLDYLQGFFVKVNPKKKSSEYAIERYVDLCESLGYKVDDKEDDSIYFYGPSGFMYFLTREGSAERFVGVSLRVGVDDSVSLDKQVEVERYVNAEFKLVKCYYEEGAIVLACEGFDTGLDDCRVFIEYAVSAVTYAFKDATKKFPESV